MVDGLDRIEGATCVVVMIFVVAELVGVSIEVVGIVAELFFSCCPCCPCWYRCC